MVTSLCRLKFLVVLLAATVILGLSGCGDTDQITAPSSSVAGRPLGIQEVSADEFKEIWMTVESVRFIGGGSHRFRDLRGWRTRTIELDHVRLDFLALNSLADLLVSDDLPATRFTKLRLRVSDPEFVRKDDSVFTEPDVRLLARGLLDLKFAEPMAIDPDDLSTLGANMDLSDGMHIIRTGRGRYWLRPQIFVTLVEPTTEMIDVVMHNALITGVDLATGVITVRSAEDGSTVQVQTTPETSITHMNGSTVTLPEIVVGWQVTVVGTLDPDTGVVTATSITMTA